MLSVVCKIAQYQRSKVLAIAVGVVSLAFTACSQPGGEVTPKAASVLPDKTSAARVRVMTANQYAGVIADVFGADIRPGQPIAPLTRGDGLLASAASSVDVTFGDILKLRRAAVTIAGQVLDGGTVEAPGGIEKIPSHRDSLVPCKPKDVTAPDDACASKFIAEIGRLLYRRPLSSEMLAEYVAQARKAASNNNDFYAGLSGVLEGMLVSPDFLMIADIAERDPDHPGSKRLDAYSVASRLSFFLWNTAPNNTLLEMAQSGELNTPKGRAKAVNMMLASPKLANGVRAFFDDMFGFDDFDTLSKDAAVYPNVSGAALNDAREQTLRTVVDLLITKKGDYRDLFTTRDTFMSSALAAVYNVPAPRQDGWAPYTFPAGSQRIGLLTQVSFLAVHSHPARSSPTKRGKALRELFLCQKVPSPPPNVDFSAVEDPKSPLKTARERLEFHRKNPVCAGCHRITDPMGLALEHFDGGGEYRTTERGAPIDTSGTLDGKDFTDVAGLEQALHDNPQLPRCLVRRVYSYATGGPLSNDSNDEIDALTKVFSDNGYRVPDLMRAITLSDAFVRISQPVAEKATAAVSSAEAGR